MQVVILRKNISFHHILTKHQRTVHSGETSSWNGYYRERLAYFRLEIFGYIQKYGQKMDLE